MYKPAPVENADAIAALRALADATRLQVARLLVEGAFNVGEIQDVLALGQSTVSHHLKVLSDAGLLACRREGRLAWYGWGSELSPAQQALQAFVKVHAEALEADQRRRLQRVFESRVEGTRRFFDAPVDDLPASAKGPAPAVDVVAAMLASLPKGGTAVDLGTGSGRLLGALRDRAQRVIGIDQSPRMLAQAGKRAEDERWSDVELRLGTLEHLPLADEEADCAVAHQVLHHVARPERALVEARRALKPGGLLVLADYLPHDREWMRDEYADLWLGFSPDQVAKLLENAGFSEVSVEARPGTADALGMFVAHGRRLSGEPAHDAGNTTSGRPRRPAPRNPMRNASERTRRRRTAAQGETE